MNNDADQKPNFCEELLEVQLEALDIQDALQRETKLLAEIESLRAENTELKVSNDLLSRTSRDDLKLLISKELIEAKTKLSAANAQMKKMAEAFKVASEYANTDDVNGMAGLICDEALADYEEFKKDSK